MTLEARLAALATAIGDDVGALTAMVTEINSEIVAVCGQGASTSIPQNAYTRLPLGTFNPSPGAAAYYQSNADGTLTILQDGYYDIDCCILAVTGTSAFRGGVWVNGTDATPANPLPGLTMYSELQATATGAANHVSRSMLLNAGFRLMPGVYNRNAAMNFQVLYMTIAKIAAQGRQGDPGPKGDQGDQGIAGGYLPVGSPIPWLVATIPNGYREFDGSAIVQATHPQLFAIFGATIPDLRGRFLLGVDGTHAIGTVGGEFTHLLTTGESGQKAVSTGGASARHTHPPGIANQLVSFYTSLTGGQFAGAAGASLQVANQTGSDTPDHTHAIAGSSAVSAHNTTPPYRTVRWITYAA